MSIQRSKKKPSDLLREIADQMEETDLEITQLTMSVGAGTVDGWDSIRSGSSTGSRKLTLEISTYSSEAWEKFWTWYNEQQREGYPTLSPNILEPMA